MASEWICTTLADLSLDISYGYTERACSEKVGPHFLRITDIQNGIVNWIEVPYCPIAHEHHEKYKLRDGDIVIARTGNSTGENYLYEGNEDAVFASYLIRFRINQQKADPKFVWYNLRTRNWWDFINNSKTGSAQAGANAKVLGRFLIHYPPLSEQRAIAHILGTLNDKIELNRKQNETLEEMARALFKSWFVDFEPVRAKMEGRWQRGQSLPTLPAHLYDLFPDRLVDSELGEILEGWELTSIDVKFDITMGQSPPENTYNKTGEGLPFYQGRADFGFRFPKRRIYCTEPTRLAKNGDTLVSVRAPVGDINMASEECAIGRGVAAVQHKTKCRSYTYQFMNSISDVFSRFNAEGTVFGSIGKKDFQSIVHIKPSHVLMLAYEKLAFKLDDQIESNEYESCTLAQLRDTLLPKLISGELRVPDAGC